VCVAWTHRLAYQPLLLRRCAADHDGRGKKSLRTMRMTEIHEMAKLGKQKKPMTTASAISMMSTLKYSAARSNVASRDGRP